ncbi:MAG: hypothetical protein PHR16_17840 [Methylovulum sp.]|nr:hypothetical protein [Methylovulum sp.]
MTEKRDHVMIFTKELEDSLLTPGDYSVDYKGVLGSKEGSNMTKTEQIRAALLSGQRPYPLTKQFTKQLVYTIYNNMVDRGEIPDYSSQSVRNDINNEPDDQSIPNVQNFEDPIQQAPPGQTIQVKRATATATGKAIDVINFSGSQNLPQDAANAVRGALGMTVVPSVLRMPMPEMLYPAMIIAIAEMHWQPMQPQDFIDTVLYEWLEACGYVPRAYMKKDDLQRLVEQYNVLDDKSPALQKYITDHQLLTPQQVQALIDVALEKIKQSMSAAPTTGSNGHNGNGADKAAPETIKPAPEVVKPEIDQQPKPIIEVSQPDGTPKPVETLVAENKDVTVAQLIKSVTDPKPKIEPPRINVTGVGSISVQNLQNFKTFQPSPEMLVANLPNVVTWMINRLRDNGIITLGQLTSKSESELAQLPNMGDLMARKIHEWLRMIKSGLKPEGAKIENSKEDSGDSTRSSKSHDSQNRVEPEGQGNGGQDQNRTNPIGTGESGSPTL